ncbi:MAG TPA: hypothetical protein VEC12_11630 [Bacteroidia bacterium]|nr:hypothetical protein [Bacteroidia bacterium]
MKRILGLRHICKVAGGVQNFKGLSQKAAPFIFCLRSKKCDFILRELVMGFVEDGRGYFY